MRARLSIFVVLTIGLLGLAPAALAASSYTSDVLSAPGLVGYWRLGEQGSQADAEGMAAADATSDHPGLYHQAVNLGVPGAIEGDPDTAAHFGSPDGYMDVPFSSALNPSTFTIEGWVELDNTGNYMRIAGTGAEYSDDTGFMFETFPNYANHAIVFDIGDGSTYHMLKGANFTPGIWYYVAATYDGTTARLYTNGQLASSLTTAYSANTSYPLRVGQSLVQSGSGQLDGSLDELAVYDTALSSATIQQHYQAGIDDGLPPSTQLVSAPSGTSNQTSASVVFSSPAVNPTFQCQLDGGAWASCSSPWQLTGLGNGSHSVVIRAIDRAGRVDPSPPTARWSVDTTVPTSAFVSGPPALTASTAATFAFTSKPGTTFTCSLDGAPATPCSSPYAVSALLDGPHTFAVEATDSAGNVETAPAVYSWTIDTAAPVTLVFSGPTALAPAAPLTFSATKSGVSFSCQVDGGPWRSCTSPVSGLPESGGAHTVNIEARDGLGNAEPTPATYAWTVGGSAQPVRPLSVSVTIPHRILTAAARRAELARAVRRCSGHKRSSCQAQAARRLTPRLRWQVSAPCALSIVVLNQSGRRVASARLTVSRLTGTTPMPAGLIAKLRPGKYTVSVQATGGSAPSAAKRLAVQVVA